MKCNILSVVKRFTDFSIKYNIRNHTFLSFLNELIIPQFTLIYDRFGFVDEKDYFFNKPNLREELTDITSQRKYTFSEMCNKRCDEIINLARDKKIFISYSGGVDSTCILSSFLKNEKLDKRNFCVFTNDISNVPVKILDIINKERIQLITYNNFRLFDDFVGDNLIIDGCCGDYLHCHINSCVDQRIDLYKIKSWIDYVYIFCKKYNYTNYDYYINCIENYIIKTGVCINSPAELWWLIAFGFIYRRNAEFRKLLSNNSEYRISFFDTLYFQNYMITNCIDNGCSIGGILYKQTQKKFIYDYIKDESYFINTSKTLSNWFTGYENSNTIFYKTTNGYYKKNVFNRKELINFIKPFLREECQDYIY